MTITVKIPSKIDLTELFICCLNFATYCCVCFFMRDLGIIALIEEHVKVLVMMVKKQ